MTSLISSTIKRAKLGSTHDVTDIFTYEDVTFIFAYDDMISCFHNARNPDNLPKVV